MTWLRILCAVIFSSSMMTPIFAQTTKFQIRDWPSKRASAIAEALAEDKTLLGKMERIARLRLQDRLSPASSIAYAAALKEIVRLRLMQSAIEARDNSPAFQSSANEGLSAKSEQHETAAKDYEIALAEFSEKLVASRMRDLQAAIRKSDGVGVAAAAAGVAAGMYLYARGDMETVDPSPWLPTLLPWPPPRSSARQTLPADLFESGGSRPGSLGDVDTRLRKALSGAGYDDVGYYGVPGGFALVTRVEQVDAEGRALAGSARWSARVQPKGGFSLLRLVQALIAAEPGHFRTLVFIVTSRPFATSARRAKLETISQWSGAGLNLLPPPVGRQPFTGDHRVTALVYEFEKAPGAREASLLVPGHLTGADHLRTSRVLTFLRRPQ